MKHKKHLRKQADLPSDGDGGESGGSGGSGGGSGASGGGENAIEVETGGKSDEEKAALAHDESGEDLMLEARRNLIKLDSRDGAGE